MANKKNTNKAIENTLENEVKTAKAAKIGGITRVRKPEEVKPEEVKPEEVKPEEVKPEEVKPEEVKPEKPKKHYCRLSRKIGES